ncbi:MAG: secretin and TonB N-terminal domain-containing protein, partial [Candidatus Omnitrophota bacterium]
MFKFFSALTVFFFMSFTASVNSYAQMEAPASQVEVESVETETTSIIPEEVKAPLPKPGNVTVNFKDVDIKTVLHYLSEVSGVDIVPSPGVEGTVTMRLRDKSWELALDIVTRNYGYVYSRDRDIIRVIPKGKLQTEEPVTEVISLNYVIQSTAEDTGPAGENIKQLMEAINSVLVEDIGEKATFLPASNAVVVTAIPSRVGAIKEMVAEVDKKTPQIMIEAKIVEVSLDKDDQLGIDWDIVISAAGAARPTTVPFMNTGILDFLPGEQRRYLTKRAAPGQDENEAFPYFNPATFVDPTAAQAAGSIFTYGTLDFSQFRAVLTMLDERTDTNIISAPRITTLNNQRAVIKVIEELYLQKEQKTSDTATTVTVEFETKPREVGVILEVVPHVNEKGEISVNLTPKVSTQPTFDSEII